MHHHLKTERSPRPNPSQRRHTATWLIAMLLSLSYTVSTTGFATAQSQPIPTGFTDDFRIFIATGVTDNAEPSEPPFVDCFNSFCDGDYFHRVVMGRSDADIDELEQMAKDFYLQRFGIDVDNPANADRIAFLYFTTDARMNYRNYVAAGKHVPADGWFVYDGGWAIIVTDPNGYSLSGEWDGFHVGQNSLFFFGNYHIMETNAAGEVQNRVNIFYRAASPVELDAGGAGSFRCELSLDGQDFPTGVHGLAQGATGFVRLSPTAIKWNIRNVLTFGPSEPFPGLGPDGITGEVPLVSDDE